MIAERGNATDIYHHTIDETKGTKKYCMANDGDDEHYVSCGRALRMHKDGTWHCPSHGEMH